jgi:hypothetical protein
MGVTCVNWITNSFDNEITPLLEVAAIRWDFVWLAVWDDFRNWALSAA